MLIAIIFWLSEIHIMSASFKAKLRDSSFYDTDLHNVAKGLVITSIVTITIIIVNNIVTIIATINGMYRTLITVSTYIVSLKSVYKKSGVSHQSKF